MLDPNLPLTINNYEEWGNPLNQPDFNLIKSTAHTKHWQRPYPTMLVTAGYNDPRVRNRKFVKLSFQRVQVFF